MQMGALPQTKKEQKQKNEFQKISRTVPLAAIDPVKGSRNHEFHEHYHGVRSY